MRHEIMPSLRYRLYRIPKAKADHPGKLFPVTQRRPRTLPGVREGTSMFAAVPGTRSERHRRVGVGEAYPCLSISYQGLE